MIKWSDNKDRPTLVAGNYTGELFKIEYHPTPEEVAQGKIPQFGPYFTFVFKMVDPVEFANTFRSGICSAKRHPKSKLTQWLQAFGLTTAQIGEQLDEALLLGKQVKLRLDADDNGQMKITAVGSVNGPAPVASTTPLTFKPAARTSQAAPVQLAQPVQMRPTVAAPTVVPVAQAKPVNLPAADLDDIPF